MAHGGRKRPLGCFVLSRTKSLAVQGHFRLSSPQHSNCPVPAISLTRAPRSSLHPRGETLTRYTEGSRRAALSLRGRDSPLAKRSRSLSHKGPAGRWDGKEAAPPGADPLRTPRGCSPAAAAGAAQTRTAPADLGIYQRLQLCHDDTQKKYQWDNGEALFRVLPLFFLPHPHHCIKQNNLLQS